MESKSPEITAQFLIAEFNALQERAKNFEEIKANRVNFYLLVVAAIGAIFSTATQAFDLFQKYFSESIVLTAAVLLLLGVSTLKDSVDYSGAIVIFFRRAGRIRRWFADFDQSIAPYLAFQPADDRPTFSVPYSLSAWRGAETVIILFNVISSTAIVACGVLKITRFNPFFASIILIVFAIMMWFLQTFYVYRKMHKAQEAESGLKRIHFPYKDYSEKIAQNDKGKIQEEPQAS
ncbi:hypothetical protein HUU05_03755 [candidate division KSB1 bacterium]|nr:hypothetical protein [candidate division KSB1 bacterium]